MHRKLSEKTTSSVRKVVLRSKIDRFLETCEHRFRVFLHYLDMRTSELAIRCAERRIFQDELGSPSPPFMQSSL